MKALCSIFAILFMGSSALADSVVATRNIRSHSIITAQDLKVIATDVIDGFQFIEDIIGQETRVTLYSGRPILVNDVGPPAVIERNQVVTLAYVTGSLMIFAEGRSLGRAGIGDRIRVLNLSSRSVVSGYVQADGTVSVSSPKF